jgi:hypothetical protein
MRMQRLDELHMTCEIIQMHECGDGDHVKIRCRSMAANECKVY